MKPELTQAQLQELFEYREDGNLYWKQAKQGRNLSKPAGSINNSSYCYIESNGKQHLAHRLIFLIHHGHLPKEIDHIDGNPSNNTIENLRPATRSQNMHNKGKQKNNTSGYKGVCRDKHMAKWKAQIQINGKLKHLGLFDCPKKAHEAYCQAAAKHHKDFANFG